MKFNVVLTFLFLVSTNAYTATDKPTNACDQLVDPVASRTREVFADVHPESARQFLKLYNPEHIPSIQLIYNPTRYWIIRRKEVAQSVVLRTEIDRALKPHSEGTLSMEQMEADLQRDLERYEQGTEYHSVVARTFITEILPKLPQFFSFNPSATQVKELFSYLDYFKVDSLTNATTWPYTKVYLRAIASLTTEHLGGDKTLAIRFRSLKSEANRDSKIADLMKKLNEEGELTPYSQIVNELKASTEPSVDHFAPALPEIPSTIPAEPEKDPNAEGDLAPDQSDSTLSLDTSTSPTSQTVSPVPVAPSAGTEDPPKDYWGLTNTGATVYTLMTMFKILWSGGK